MFDLVMFDLEGTLIDSVPKAAAEPVAPAVDAQRALRLAQSSRLYPGVERTLMRLHAAAVRIALVTDESLEHARSALDAHRLRYWFDLIVAGDTLPARKPDPLPLRYCLDCFAIARRRALLVGSKPADVAAARAAGIAVWFVNHGAPVPMVPSPDRTLTNIAAIADAVEGARLRVA
jgi:phosphoglycolate phosphatase